MYHPVAGLQEDHGEDDGDERERGQGPVAVQEHPGPRRTHTVEHVLQEDLKVAGPSKFGKEVHGRMQTT